MYLRLSWGHFLLCFPIMVLYATLISAMCATCPAHFVYDMFTARNYCRFVPTHFPFSGVTVNC